MANKSIVDLIKLMEDRSTREETVSWLSLIEIFKKWIQ